MVGTNPETFRAKEREAFKEAKEKGFEDIEWQPPRQISAETIQNFRSMEATNTGLWGELRGRTVAKSLIKAAKNKQPKRYLGILTDKKPVESILTKDESEGTMEI